MAETTKVTELGNCCLRPIYDGTLPGQKTPLQQAPPGESRTRTTEPDREKLSTSKFRTNPLGTADPTMASPSMEGIYPNQQSSEVSANEPLGGSRPDCHQPTLAEMIRNYKSRQFLPTPKSRGGPSGGHGVGRPRSPTTASGVRSRIQPWVRSMRIDKASMTCYLVLAASSTRLRAPVAQGLDESRTASTGGLPGGRCVRSPTPGTARVPGGVLP